MARHSERHKREPAMTALEELLKAAEVFFLARGPERRESKAELRRAVKRLRAEQADEENEEEAA
jgi:hypothetical protein